jgi:two-component system, LytTR family, sensor histidine kinase AlgZ
MQDDSRLSLLPSPKETVTPALPEFELCHVGVVLRALLGVQGLVAVLLLLLAQSGGDWLTRFLAVSFVTVPALLAWLTSVCALRLRLAAWSRPRVRLMLPLLGATCALLPWLLGVQFDRALGDNSSVDLPRTLAVAGCGALAAWALQEWLALRARAQAPSGLQARWMELQSRIRPHFLFNTLNTAMALVRVDPQQAERVLEDLSELFRAALAAPDWTSTLGDEVLLARRYLDIEQLRFGERLRVDWQLDAACNAARLPPLLLQPLVENAVRYGVEPNEAGGDVVVRIRRLRSGEVELLVRNSLAAPAPGGNGLALANVRERLRLLHDVSARLTLEPEPQRFGVRLVFPLA